MTRQEHEAAAVEKPMAAQRTWRRVFAGGVDEIAEAARWIDSITASLDLAGPTAFAMQVCLEELMSNIARHGGRSSSASRAPQRPPIDALSISVGVEAFADRIVMTIEDNGRPFDLVKAPAKRVDGPIERLQPGGLGVQLVKTFGRNLSYRRTETGNCVSVEFMREV